MTLFFLVLRSCGDLDVIGELFSEFAGDTLPLYAVCDLLEISQKELASAHEKFELPFVSKEMFGELIFLLGKKLNLK